MAKKRYPRTIQCRIPAEKQELLISWSGKNRACFEVYTNYDSMAALFVAIAQDNKIDYQLSRFGVFMKLPSKLLPFKIPVKRGLDIPPEDRNGAGRSGWLTEPKCNCDADNYRKCRADYKIVLLEFSLQ